MSISVLNNISSLVAENAVSNTQANLQNTLTQLSTGLRINSGADDPAGLSIADGLGANISALTQSGQNASNGVGLLQTADGALSQVTTILNQAVTIATEASNSGLTTSQSTALNTEFQSILSEINQIGSTTNFNGTSVFGGTLSSDATSITSSKGGLATTTALTQNAVYTINEGNGNTFSYTAGATSTIADLTTAFAAAKAGTPPGGADGGGGTYTFAGSLSGALAVNGNGNLALTGAATGTSFTDNGGAAADLAVGTVNAGNNLLTAGGTTTITSGSDSFTFTAGTASTVNDLVSAISAAGGGAPFTGSAAAGNYTGSLPTGFAASLTANGQVDVTGGQIASATTTDTSVLGSFTVSGGGTADVFTSDGTTGGSDNTTTNIGSLSAGALGLNGTNLDSSTSAQSALTAITSAINTVAAQRGTIGASVNQLTSDTSVETTEVQNLTSAQNNVQNADIATVTTNLTQFNILEQTGFDALSQSNSAEQNVLKLLQ
jgi:flagellin